MRPGSAPAEAECELLSLLDEMSRTPIDRLPELGRKAADVIERVDAEIVKRCLMACIRGVADGIEHGIQGAKPPAPGVAN